MSSLVTDSYGKSAVRLMKIDRTTEPHRVHDLTVSVSLRGSFEAAHRDGDNSRVLPTDTMRNTIYALGDEHPVEPIEPFAVHLARHFTDADDTLTMARVAIAAGSWRPLATGGTTHPSAFALDRTARRTCAVEATPDGISVEAGVEELTVLKTAHSGFVGFRTDELTTLAEVDDRLLRTVLTARWRYADTPVDFDRLRATIHDALLGAFAEHDSLSVQHTLYFMADRALAATEAIDRIHLVMPNRHCVLFDLGPLGRRNDNRIFVPMEEPYGLIEATVAR